MAYMVQGTTLLAKALLIRCVIAVLLIVLLRLVFDGWLPEVVRWSKPVLGMIFLAWMQKQSKSF